MDRPSLIFCILALVVTIGLSWMLYPAAAIAPEKLSAWTTAAEPEAIPDLDLGEFGVVSVSDLMQYYIENPPAPASPGARPERKVRFQGC